VMGGVGDESFFLGGEYWFCRELRQGRREVESDRCLGVNIYKESQSQEHDQSCPPLPQGRGLTLLYKGDHLE
jgi:hypothetical protein